MQAKATRKYLNILDATSLREVEDRSVVAVRSELQRSGSLSLPIRLSSVAEAFLICPRPQFDPHAREGQLEFDRASGHFVITLGTASIFPKGGPTPLDLFGATDDPFVGALTRRLRFTYAHEFAHRFCFVPNDGQWERAIRLCLPDRERASDLAQFRKLALNEEQLCNRVAGRLLVPIDTLRELVQPFLQESGEGLVSFGRCVDTIARSFGVTDRCLLVQVQRAIHSRDLTIPDRFCLMLVGLADSTGASRLTSRRLRVLIAVIPQVISEIRMQLVFPGLPLDHLGPDAKRQIGMISAAVKDGVKSGVAMCDLILSTHQQSTLTCSLAGWWKRHAGLKGSEEILLWGLISTAA